MFSPSKSFNFELYALSKALYWLLLFSLAFFCIYSRTQSPNSLSSQNNFFEIYRGPLIPGGVISQIVADPNDANHLFALQEQTDEWQTIVESKDGGEHWYTVSSFHHFWIHNLAIDPSISNVLYAGGDTGIYRSDNSGIDWLKMADFGPMINISATKTLYSIEKLYGTPECPSGQSNFVRSHDGGKNWEKVPINCGIYGDISSSRSNPSLIYLREIDPISNEQALVRSIDSGDTWSFIPLTGPFFTMGLFPVAIDPNQPEKLYTSSGTGIIISQDGGQTWHLKLKTIITGGFLFSFADNEIYAGLVSTLVGSPGAVYRSNDGGDTWDKLPVQIQSNLDALLTISCNYSSAIYISLNGYGIERSIDDGQTWKSENEGLLSTTKTARFAISSSQPHQIFAIIDWPRKALFKSIDNGLSWNLLLSDNTLNDVIIDPRNANWVWTVGEKGWIASQDGGYSWRLVSSLSGTDLAVSPNAPDRPCSTHSDQGEGFVVCRTLDENGKEIWQSYSILGSKALSNIAISPNNGLLIFVSGTPDYKVGTIYQSEDGGKNWTESLRSLPNYIPLDLAVSSGDPAKIIAVFCQPQFDNLLVYESLDAGKTWHDITAEMDASSSNLWTQFTFRVFVFFDTSDTIYFIIGDTVLVQPTSAQTWKTYGVINDRIRAAAIEIGSPGFLWLAGDKNGWKVPLNSHFFIWLPILLR